MPETNLAIPAVPRKEPVGQQRHRERLIRYLHYPSRLIGVRAYALFGSAFPTHSHKYISALGLLDSTLRRHPGCDELVLSSSGNTGLASAWLLSQFGFRGRLTCVVDARLERAKRESLELLGIRLVQVEARSLEERLKRIPPLLARRGTAYLDQYTDPAAVEAHRRITGPMVKSLMNCKDLAAVVLPVGTGSSMGIALYLQELNPELKTFLADPEGSGIFCSPGVRLITGAGAEFATPVAVRALARLRAAEIIQPTNAQAVNACWRLRRHQHAFVGGSSGLALAALEIAARRLPRNARVLLLFPDGGEPYLDTVYSVSWLESKGLEVNHAEDTLAA